MSAPAQVSPAAEGEDPEAEAPERAGAEDAADAREEPEVSGSEAPEVTRAASAEGGPSLLDTI